MTLVLSRQPLQLCAAHTTLSWRYASKACGLELLLLIEAQFMTEGGLDRFFLMWFVASAWAGDWGGSAADRTSRVLHVKRLCSLQCKHCCLECLRLIASLHDYQYQMPIQTPPATHLKAYPALGKQSVVSAQAYQVGWW